MFDISTQNTSFLVMSKYLKDRGIKNNKFMLQLYDEKLAGVDVYDPNLSNEMKARIYVETCRNFWYFLREVAKVPQEGSNDGVHFQLNVGNMAAAFCCINNINHLLVLPRQVGKTVVEVMFSLWVHLFAGTYINETYLHKAQSGSVDNLSRLKKFRELLPKWLVGMVQDGQDKDNLEEKYSYKRKNRIQALSSAANDSAADKLGRGSSTAMVYADEFAFLERNEIVMNALVPAWSTSAEVAKNNGAPYGIRITTTPNTLSLPQAAYCYNRIKEPACKFTFILYDQVDIYTYVHNNSGNDFVYIEYSWQECGKTKEWYDKQCRLIGDTLIINRELNCVWPESTEGSIFTEDQLNKIRYHLKPIVLTLTVDGYGINFYEKPNFLMNYIISCDVSGGLSLDRSVINIIDPADFHVVGLFFNPRIDTEAFKHLIKSLMTEWFIHAILNVENNSYGLNILDSLMRDPAIEPRMYREYAERQGEKTLNDGTVVKKKTKKMVYGTSTNAQSRKLMMEMLPSLVDECPEIFVSDDFYNEVKNLYRTKTGRVEARPGFHDDIIMSYLITRYSIAYGKCFKNMFGILPVATLANAHCGEESASRLFSNFGNIISSANQYSEVDFSDNPIIQTARDMMDKDGLDGYISPEEQKKQSENRLFSIISSLNRN